ncbi:MAG TPA: hypothetical protein PKL15_13580 [Saprospiraceae bacterium]|nr:hypothetical protein [Saprospiraceae bacterium]
MENNTPAEPQSRLKELTGASWNLELIISGAAIVLTTYLPDAVENLFHYYHFNLSVDWSSGASFMQVLAYAFFKTVAYLMMTMFVVHLAMRAFWVAVVGLQAAYPEGIRYDKIPNVPPSLQRHQQRRFGDLESYTVRLDRLCNQLLAFTFLVGLMGVSLGVVYAAIFGLAQVSRLFIPESLARQLLLGAFAVFMSFISVYGLLVKKFQQTPDLDEKYGTRLSGVYVGLMAVITPVFYKPMNYLSLTFFSNLEKRRMYGMVALVTTFVMVSVVVIFGRKMGDLRNRHLFELRDFYTSGTPETEMRANRYDNLRASPVDLPPVSIPSDVLEGPFLQVFVAYPKQLDAGLQRHCPAAPAVDSLYRTAKRAVLDQWKLDCMGSFFRVYVNDSLYARPDWIFYEKPGATTRGLLAYLPSDGFRRGKNLLTVKIPHAEKPDSLLTLGVVQFWFAPQ